MSDVTTDEEVEEAPGPEQPVEVEIDLAASGTTIGPPHVRDADVEADDLRDQVEAEEGEQLPAAGAQVESLQAAGAHNGLALVINGADIYIFNDQMTATLKQIADQAVAGLVL